MTFFPGNRTLQDHCNGRLQAIWAMLLISLGEIVVTGSSAVSRPFQGSRALGTGSHG
jgi:hypothetical protein